MRWGEIPPPSLLLCRPGAAQTVFFIVARPPKLIALAALFLDAQKVSVQCSLDFKNIQQIHAA
jgi:hypothetical protein